MNRDNPDPYSIAKIRLFFEIRTIIKLKGIYFSLTYMLIMINRKSLSVNTIARLRCCLWLAFQQPPHPSY